MSLVQVMGIVNVTPDSFSDGGKYNTPEEAVRRVRNLVDEGADIIDLGAESTRPGATALKWQDEWKRLMPVLKLLSDAPCRAQLSVDTYHPETAALALKCGVSMVNCVYAEPVPRMIELCRAHSAALIAPVKSYDAALFNGLSSYYLDPMIGFNTSRDEDLELIKSIPELAVRHPVAVGVSRKRLVKKLTGEKVTGKNLGGNLSLAVWCAEHGARLLRVHDVRETVQAIKVLKALADV